MSWLRTGEISASQHIPMVVSVVVENDIVVVARAKMKATDAVTRPGRIQA